MKIFKGFNEKSTCSVCNTNEDKECILIPIVGTQEGMNAQATAVHLDCIDLWYHPPTVDNHAVIIQVIRNEIDNTKPIQSEKV